MKNTVKNRELGVSEIIQKAIYSNTELYEKTKNATIGDTMGRLIIPMIGVSLLYGIIESLNAKIIIPFAPESKFFLITLGRFMGFLLTASLIGVVIFIGTRIFGHKSTFRDSMRISAYSYFTALTVNLAPTVLLAGISILAAQYYPLISIVSSIGLFVFSLYLIGYGISTVHGVSKLRGILYYMCAAAVIAASIFVVALAVGFALGVFR